MLVSKAVVGSVQFSRESSPGEIKILFCAIHRAVKLNASLVKVWGGCDKNQAIA
jgi:hypothetical protein